MLTAGSVWPGGRGPHTWSFAGTFRGSPLDLGAPPHPDLPDVVDCGPRVERGIGDARRGRSVADHEPVAVRCDRGDAAVGQRPAFVSVVASGRGTR